MFELIKTASKLNNINSLIHVGGHTGQEVNFYKSLNLEKVIYFEPVKEFADEIKTKIKNLPNFVVHNCALGNEVQSKLIYIADKGINDNSGSTSLLEPRKSDISFSKSQTIKVKKYTSFQYSNIDLAVLDTQGYELEVLKGFEDKITTFKFLIVEFSNFEGYINQTVYKDLNKFLVSNNFSFLTQRKKVLKIFPNSTSGSYGDALYINNNLLSDIQILKSKVLFILSNNLISDVLIKYLSFATWKNIFKKILNN